MPRNSLAKYRQKRAFNRTPEPPGERDQETSGSFVVQRHSARRLHYDFRLEVAGVLKSWAVPKGPPLEGGEKRLAIHVEDHPVEYGKFEGQIPKGNYGAGDVRIWDRGTFETEGTESAAKQIEDGEIKFRLRGTRLNGRFVLVKLRRSERQNEWLFIRKAEDAVAPGVPAGPQAAEAARPAKQSRKESAVFDPGTLPGAVRAPMPSSVKVMLANISDKPFSDENWLYEIKWDGGRAIFFAKDGAIKIKSRSDRDITGEYPELRDFARTLSAREAIVDGEIVSLDEEGRSDFKKLQSRFGVIQPSAALLEQVPVVYYAFDILHCDGYDLRRAPLIERKNLLQRLLQPSKNVRYSDHQIGHGRELYEVAKQKGLEGIIAKKKDSPYIGGRTSLWLKLKIVHDLDVVIGGWTEPRKSRDHFGALIMGLYRGKELHYVGSVGTGFDGRSLADIHAQLKKLVVAKSPFETPPKVKEKITWVKPEIVARVKFGEWTNDEKLRQPVFMGFLDDRDASSATFAEQKKQPLRAEDRPAPEPKKDPKKDPNQAPSRTPAQPETEPEMKKEPARKRQTAQKTATRTPASRSTSIDSEASLENELAKGKAESVSATLDGKQITLSNLNKVYFPEAGHTKRDVILYYLRMAKYILPFLKDRPLVLKRYPDGIHGEFFFQKEAPKSRPDWIETASIHSDDRGGKMDYLMANDVASLLYVTNLGCIDHNPWSSSAESEETPDYVFFDFDPTDGTGFDVVVALAKSTEEHLKRLGMRTYLKTSGASGFHIYVPLEPKYSYAQIQMFATAIGQMVKREHGAKVTFERSIAKRPKGSVLMDAVQNAHGKPLAAPYSIRPVVSAAVSTPVLAKELTSKLRADEWNMDSVFARLKSKGDLWGDFWKHRQNLEDAVRRAERL